MEACLIGCISDESFWTVFFYDGVLAFRYDNFHLMSIFWVLDKLQFTFFIELFAACECLSAIINSYLSIWFAHRKNRKYVAQIVTNSWTYWKLYSLVSGSWWNWSWTTKNRDCLSGSCARNCCCCWGWWNCWGWWCCWCCCGWRNGFPWNCGADCTNATKTHTTAAIATNFWAIFSANFVWTLKMHTLSQPCRIDNWLET